jgi:hypothetical protein
MLYSLQEDDVLKNEQGTEVESSPARMAAENNKRLLANVVGAL